MQVLGIAGTGKSFIINNSINLLLNHLLVCAFSGKASANSKGGTIHSCFGLPLNSNKYEPLKDSLSKYQKIFKYITHIIIDEKSLIGRKMLGWIDRRCREFKPDNKHLPFGGMSVILMGDDNQIPCRGDKPFH